MKRHPGLVPLSHDHRLMLFVAQVLKRGPTRYPDVPTTATAKAAYASRFATMSLLPHMQLEETLLFPLARGLTAETDTLIDTLVEEHRQLEALLAALNTTAELETTLDQLGLLLEGHVRSEERQLFQRLQGLLPDETLATLGPRWREALPLLCLPTAE